MNFLAHLYLSGDNRHVILGNLIADSVKGSDLECYKPDVQKGIRLHRLIDEYTDKHPIVQASRERLYKNYHKFSGVVVDMYYDHFLASNWTEYSDEDLYDLSVRSYEILILNFRVLPAKIRRILPFMVASNWLVSYADMDRMKRFFTGMSKRTKFYSGMENAVNDLKENYEAFHKEFREFFPQLIEYVAECNRSGKI